MSAMNDEKLRFVAGGPAEVAESAVDPQDETLWIAQVHVIGEEVWLSRICVYGTTQANAEGLRDRLLWSLQCPTTAEMFQYKSKVADFWHNCADVADCVQAKAAGHEVRALYVRKPLEEV